MAQLAIEVNGKPYIVGCEDGHEGRLRELAALIDAQVKQLSRDVGQLGETRLILMGALMLADELSESKARLAAAEAESSSLREERERAESAVASAVESAAQQIEALASD
ncbi:MAG TPA: cell division protein ZapA [Caulobacteraceae bacterium]